MENIEKYTKDQLIEKIEVLHKKLIHFEESEVNLMQILNESNEGISVTDEHGKIKIWNKSLEEITRIKKTETLNKYIWDIQVEKLDNDPGNTEKIKKLRETLTEILKTGKAPWLNKTLEREFTSPNGDVKIVSGYLYTIKTQKGFLIVSVSVDITEKKKIESDLKKSEEKFKNLVTSMNDLVFVFDENKRFTYYHAPESEALFKSPDEFIGKLISEVMPDHINTLFEKAFTEIKEGQSSRFEYFLEIQGVKKWFSVQLSALNKKGKFDGALAVVRDITEQKKVEEEINKQVNRNKELLNTTMDGFILADDKGEIIDVNPAYCNMIEYSYNELIKMNIQELEIKIPEKELQKRINQMISRGSDRFDTKHKSKSGRIIDLNVSITILPEGNKSFVAAFVRDITKLKKTENELNETSSNLQALLDNRKDSIWSLDRDYNYLIFNKPYAEVILKELGVHIKKGMNAMEIHPKEVREFWKSKFEPAFNGEVVSFEFEHELKGKKHYFEVTLNPIFTDGIVTGASALSIDITERKNAELEIKKSAELWRNTFRSVNDGIMVLDIDHNIIQANQKMLDIYNLEMSDLLDKKCWEVVHKTENYILECPFECSKKTANREIMELEFEDKWYKITIDPIFDHSKHIVGAVHLMSDITERKVTEQELKQHREKLEAMVKERTEELESTLNEVERMNKLFVGREFRIKELKDEIEYLKRKK